MSWPQGEPFAGAAARRDAIAGRVAVVTGASRGLGAGLAAHFAAAGLHLGLCARHRPDLVAMTRPRAHHGRVDPAEPPLVASVDVVDFDALSAFADTVVTKFGRIDLWVNNAGVLQPIGPMAEAEPNGVAAHIAVNVTGVAYGSMVFARHVRSRAGTGVLINISSGAAERSYAGWGPYCSSKAAVDRLSDVMATEEMNNGLRVHSVAPGVVDTDMQSTIRATDVTKFPEVERFRALKRAGTFNSPQWIGERLLELAFGALVGAPVVLRVPDEPHAAGATG